MQLLQEQIPVVLDFQFIAYGHWYFASWNSQKYLYEVSRHVGCHGLSFCFGEVFFITCFIHKYQILHQFCWAKALWIVQPDNKGMVLAPECSSCCFTVYFDLLDARLEPVQKCSMEVPFQEWKWWCCVRGFLCFWNGFLTHPLFQRRGTWCAGCHRMWQVQDSPPWKPQFLCWPWEARGCSCRHSRTLPALPQHWVGVDGWGTWFRRLAVSKHSWCIPMEIQLPLYSLFPKVSGLGALSIWIICILL